jgi:hypothetical protein
LAGVTFGDVGKVYPDGTRAVGDMDLEITDGEFMVLRVAVMRKGELSRSRRPRSCTSGP